MRRCCAFSASMDSTLCSDDSSSLTTGEPFDLSNVTEKHALLRRFGIFLQFICALASGLAQVKK